MHNKNIHNEYPLFIPRLGFCETEWYQLYSQNPDKALSTFPFYTLQNNAGLYHTYSEKEQDKIKDLYNHYYTLLNNIFKDSRYLSTFNVPHLNIIYNNILNKYPHLTKVPFKEYVEPFFQPSPNFIQTITKDKCVLIVSPFCDTYKEQLSKSDRKDIILDMMFNPNQSFIFYNSFFTASNNKLHSNWLETLNIMFNEISKLDFDIALLGCGGYGVLLSHMIYTRLNKSALYIGGGLQLFFGVIGKRWENREDFINMFKERGVYPFLVHPKETFKDTHLVEGSCYW